MHLLIVRGINLPAPPGMKAQSSVVFFSEYVGESSEEHDLLPWIPLKDQTFVASIH